MLHPYLQSSEDSVVRLIRAHYWSVQDLDFRHSAYWQQQVQEAESGLLAALRAQGLPEDRTDRMYRQRARHSMEFGYQMAAKRRERSGVVVPGGFESGSVCNTRTLSHGGDFLGSATPRTLSNGLDS